VPASLDRCGRGRTYPAGGGPRSDAPRVRPGHAAACPDQDRKAFVDGHRPFGRSEPTTVPVGL